MKPSKAPHKEPIAIIGMSCRFPGADTLAAFWELLKNGKDTIGEIPKERWDADKYYDPDPQAERKTHQRQASLLSNIHDFDPLFFNISPAEATEMSPSQKLMMELAWEAIEHSSLPFSDVKGKNVGVYVGNIWTDFEHYRKEKNARATLHSAVGMSSNVIANRVSFALGFTGPSLVIDTGCSASLVALHLACQSLLSCESDMVIVGGINHILDPDKYVELTRFGGLSLTGKCSTFDRDADGFVRGEGGGALLLKKLSDAERDGNRIYAVIRGTAVNNNGYNDTLPATSTQGQKSLLEKVYRDAAIAPHEVHYVEAHGTGTRLGDPNEARAIGEFFSTGRGQHKLRVGSVKTNLGHTEATAGIAGLIKVALAMQHKTLPPNLNFNNPNPDIPFDDLKIEVQKELSAWPVHNGEAFKAGVNSFGWGGTNAHVVLEEYRGALQQNDNMVSGPSGIYSLPLSAKSSPALKAYARLYAEQLAAGSEDDFKATCVAAALRKPRFDHNVLFSAHTRDAMRDKLQAFADDETEVTPAGPVSSDAKIVFVFPGQGAQWLGMGRELLVKETVFRETIEACEAAFRPFTDWSLLDQLNATEETSRLNEISVIQPALFAMQVALARLWMSWGIAPHTVVGHSMGEVAAAHIAGALTLHDAARIICERSRLMKTVSGQGGAMAVTELSRDEADRIVATYPGRLSVAVNNSPKSTVLAGDKSAIDEVLAGLEEKGLFNRLVKVDVASHSPQMEPLMEPLHTALQAVSPCETVIPFLSTVHNKVMTGRQLNADYWVQNLRGTVQFASAVETLLHDEHVVFIEANPHPVLVNAVAECAAFHNKRIITAASLQRDNPEQEAMLNNLADLFSKGYPVNWQRFYNTQSIPHAALPAYPFQRERYEIEDLSNELATTSEVPAKYPLLGHKINLAHTPASFYWESDVSIRNFPYLREHVIHDRVELPESCYIEMVLEAATEIFGPETPVRIHKLTFSRSVVLTERDRIPLQVKLTLRENQRGQVHIFKKDDQESGWVQLAEGHLDVAPEDPSIPEIFEKIEYHAPAYTEGINYYTLLRSVGLNYGRQFQLLTGLDKVNNLPVQNVLFSIKADRSVALTSEKYRIHPALMSSFFQSVYGRLTGVLEEGSYLDVQFSGIEEVVLQAPVNYHRELRGFMVLHPVAQANGRHQFTADITIANHDNSLVMSITGLRGTAASRQPRQANGRPEAGQEFLERYGTIPSEADKAGALEQMIARHVARIVKMPAARIKKTMTFKGLGVDSLMAVQLRNLLEKEVQMKLQVGTFWAHPSIQDYSLYLRNVLAARFDGPAAADEKPGHGTAHNNWFTIPAPNPGAAFRVFCFHDAGGSTSLFDGWENYFGPASVELVLVEMPGRGRRLEETPYVDCRKFVEDILPAFTDLLDKPYVLVGHSMGGLLAFEIIRALRRIQAPLPHTLFISSTSGLTAYDKNQVDYTLPDAQLVAMYPHLDVCHVGSLEMQRLLIDILRADLQFLHHYEYTTEEALDIPIVAIHGEDDERVKRHQIAQWEKETSSSFRLIERPGGHRYIAHDAEFVTQLVLDEIMLREDKDRASIPVFNPAK